MVARRVMSMAVSSLDWTWKSVMYCKKIEGPSIDHCEITEEAGIDSDECSSSTTDWMRLSRIHVIHFSGEPLDANFVSI